MEESVYLYKKSKWLWWIAAICIALYIIPFGPVVPALFLGILFTLYFIIKKIDKVLDNRVIVDNPRVRKLVIRTNRDVDDDASFSSESSRFVKSTIGCEDVSLPGKIDEESDVENSCTESDTSSHASKEESEDERIKEVIEEEETNSQKPKEIPILDYMWKTPCSFNPEFPPLEASPKLKIQNKS